jgi:hypothetical protein
MIDKININPVHFDDSSPGRNGPKRAGAVNQQGDASLQINYDRLIEQAAKIPPEDVEVIHKAQELLRSGRLDNAENIRQAAENILKFGV